ncbi:MAG: hypothetical protein WCH76_04490, partial [Candidatus Riflemargulisbacteria bacterium]
VWIRNANGVVSSGNIIPSSQIQLDTIAPYFSSWEITKDILVSSDISDHGEQSGFLRVGTYNITFNISEEVILTPEIELRLNSLVHSFISSLNRINDSTFTSELIVTVGMTNGKFELVCNITDNALHTANAVVDQYRYFWIDTTINSPTNLFLYDIDKPDQTSECNDNVVGIRYSANADYYRWIWGEATTKFATPDIDSALWQDYFPSQYPFQNLAEGIKTMYLWVKDRAGNISERQSVSINYLPINYLQDAYINIDLNNTYLLAGEHTLTLAIHELGVVTPSLWLKVSTLDVRLPLELFNLTTSNGFSYYQTTFDVPANGSYDGSGFFEIKVTRNNGVIYNFVGAAYINIEGDRDVVFDTRIISPNGFSIMDKDSNSSEYTDDFVVNVRIFENSDHYEWIIGEEYSAQPSANNQRWTRVRPSQYMFKNNVIELKRVYLWAKDRAGNISQRAVAAIDYNPSNQSLSAYASVYLLNTLVKESVLAITIDIRDTAIDTPNVWVYLNKTSQRITLDIYEKVTNNVDGMYYLATLDILGNEAYDGPAHFEILVTNSGRAVIDLTGENYTYIGRDKAFIIDTSINIPEFVVYDFESNRTDFTNELIPNLLVTNDSDVVGWLIGELAFNRPTLNDTAWLSVAPSQYHFRNVFEGTKKVYLWVKDGAGNINQSVVSHEILYDRTDPQLLLFGRWDKEVNNIYFVTLNVSEFIDITPNLTYSLNAGEFTGLANLFPLSATSRDVWLATIDVTNIANSVWKAEFAVVVTDNAWNVQRNFLSLQGTGFVRDTTVNFITIDVPLEYYREGSYLVTFNFDTQVPFNITPEIILHHVGYSGNQQFTWLSVDYKELISPVGVRYVATMDVLPGGIHDGLIYFHVKVTRDSGVVVAITSDLLSETWIEGSNKVTFDTGIFVLSVDVFDKSSGFYGYLNDQVMGVSINEENGITKWLISETQATTPSIEDRNWSDIKPFEFRLNYLREEVKTIYLWVKDIAGNIALTTTHITYDVTNPVLSSQLVKRVALTGTENVNAIGGSLYLRVGTYNITFSFSESLLVTPEISVVDELSLFPVSFSLLRVSASTFICEYVITNGTSEGTHNVHYNATDNAVNRLINQPFTVFNFFIDRTNPIVTLDLLDLDSGSNVYSNSRNVRVIISVNELVGYIVTEDMLYNASTSHNWSSTIDVYQITQNIGLNKLGLWVKDKAGNISFASASILLDTAIPGVVMDISANPLALPEGNFRLSFNVVNVASGIASTPNIFFVPFNRIPIMLTLNQSVIANTYVSTLSISTYTGDGPGYFVFMVTDNAGNSIYINNPYLSELFKVHWSGGTLTSNVLEVSTNVLLPVIVAFDIDTLSSRYSNDQVVGLRISNDYQATAWLIKEYDSQPLSNDVLWKYDRPVEHVFWNNKNEVKTLYLWTKDQTSKVSPQSVMTRITYDTIDPWIESIIVGNQGHMNIGTFNITINLSEMFDTGNAPTPSFWMTINGVRRELFYNVSGAYSFITSSIVVTSGMAGTGMFYVKISDNANNPGTMISSGAQMVFDFTSPNIDYLFIQDMDTGGMLYTNEREIKLLYKVTEPPAGEVYRWYVTENTGVVIDNYFQDWFAEAPVTYRMSEVQGTKNIVLWVMDKAYNTKFMAGTIIYDSTVSPNIPGVTVDISMHPMAIVTGTVFITLNIDNIESGIFATPSFYVLMDVGQRQIPIAISGVTRNGMIYEYYGSFVINTNSGDGPARFVMQARTRAFEDFSVISSIRFASNDFQNRLIINTIVKTPTINVYDLDLSAQRNNTYDINDVWTNDQTIGVSIGNDEQAVAWLLNEDQSASPVVSSSFWVSERPVKYTFKNYINEKKTLYLWTKNFNNQISSMRAVITINYDDTQPYVASIEMPN